MFYCTVLKFYCLKFAVHFNLFNVLDVLNLSKCQPLKVKLGDIMNLLKYVILR